MKSASLKMKLLWNRFGKLFLGKHFDRKKVFLNSSFYYFLLCFSTIGLNQNIEWSHCLLQHMLNHLWKPSRGETVLKKYLSGVIRLSNHSLSTLYLLRKRISFPDTLLEIKVCISMMTICKL